MIFIIILFSVIIPACCTRKHKRRRNVNATAATQAQRNIEKQRIAAQRNAERIRKEQFKRIQAEQDIIHYTQVKNDLLTAYERCDAGAGDTEKAIRKRIAYDNMLRTVEKKIEKASFDARTGY